MEVGRLEVVSFGGGAETDVRPGIRLRQVFDDQLIHVRFVFPGIPRLQVGWEVDGDGEG